MFVKLSRTLDLNVMTEIAGIIYPTLPEICRRTTSQNLTPQACMTASSADTYSKKGT